MDMKKKESVIKHFGFGLGLAGAISVFVFVTIAQLNFMTPFIYYILFRLKSSTNGNLSDCLYGMGCSPVFQHLNIGKTCFQKRFCFVFYR